MNEMATFDSAGVTGRAEYPGRMSVLP
jgi:hypothetical protein